jgi:hypothetical protein
MWVVAQVKLADPALHHQPHRRNLDACTAAVPPSQQQQELSAPWGPARRLDALAVQARQQECGSTCSRLAYLQTAHTLTQNRLVRVLGMVLLESLCKALEGQQGVLGCRCVHCCLLCWGSHLQHHLWRPDSRHCYHNLWWLSWVGLLCVGCEVLAELCWV